MNFTKDPDARLDFQFDWTAWLEASETIDDHTITADEGITLEEHTEHDGVVTVWLTGGTNLTRYKVACRIDTSAGRTDERTMIITARER